MSTILIDSLNCNPTTGSNAESGYGFVRQALLRHRVCLLTHGELFDRLPNPLAETHPDNLQVFRIGRGLLGKLGRQADYLSQSYFHARKILRQNPIDIVHSVEPNQYRFTRPLVLTRDVPYVLGPLNGGDAYPPQSFLDDIAERYQNIFCGSPSSARKGLALLAERINHALVHGAIAKLSTSRAFQRAERIVIGTRNCLNNIPERFHHKCIQVPCFGIDTGQFSPPESTKKRSEPLTVGYAGRITAWKGLDFLIEAVAQLPRDLPWTLHVAGSGNGDPADETFERYCRHLVSTLGLDKNIVFLGQVPRVQLARFYRQCDLFCVPSLWEPMGMVYIEAMACGRPVVAMDSGGPREVIRADAGVLVTPRSHKQFAADLGSVLRELLSDEARREEMGRRAREYVLEEFDWPVVGNKMEAVYQQLL